MSKENLHLPKTAFSMKADLAKKEPDILKKLEKTLKVKKNSFCMMALPMLMGTFTWELR